MLTIKVSSFCVFEYFHGGILKKMNLQDDGVVIKTTEGDSEELEAKISQDSSSVT